MSRLKMFTVMELVLLPSGLRLLRIFNAEGTKVTESGLKSLRADRQRRTQGKQVWRGEVGHTGVWERSVGTVRRV